MNITDPKFIYTPAVSTDVRKTWARYGFVPPSEVRDVAEKYVIKPNEPVLDAAKG